MNMNQLRSRNQLPGVFVICLALVVLVIAAVVSGRSAESTFAVIGISLALVCPVVILLAYASSRPMPAKPAGAAVRSESPALELFKKVQEESKAH